MNNDPIERVTELANYTPRKVDGWKNGSRVWMKSKIKRGEPYLYISSGRNDEEEWFDTAEELDERFDELVEKHGLDED